jgi:hypothetical protein
MNDRELSRRQFLAGLSTAAKGSLIVLSLPAILTACRQANEQNPTASADAQYTILSNDLAIELDAVSARIVPTDDTPGAREAGSVRFMDVVLADGRQDQLTILQTGMVELNASASREFGVSSFAALSETQQDALLTAIETTPFFGTVRFLTVASLFALPFGYYDADYAARGE